jgi:glycosyltransferase involved in cell wall biosynthesis
VTLVTVVTATHKRPGLLTERCIPSVWAQTYSPLEHLIISDGPDPELRSQLEDLGYSTAPRTNRRLVELGRNWGLVGNAARAAGAWLAAGDWVCYLDDDNEYLPEHVEVMAAEAGRAGAGLVCTAWRTPDGDAAGWAPPGVNHTDASSFLHAAGLLGVSAWQPADGYAADGALVGRWVAAGVRWSFLPEPTMTYHPADPVAYRQWLRAMASRDR